MKNKIINIVSCFIGYVIFSDEPQWQFARFLIVGTLIALVLKYLG